MIDLKRDTWMALQDMSSEDVADAICDSQAIVEAIQSNAWSDVADMVRARVELKAQRLEAVKIQGDIACRGASPLGSQEQ